MGRLVLTVGICAALFTPMDVARAAERTSVALTATVLPQAAAQDQKLAENLLALIELEVQSAPTLLVVERRQIDLAISELLLDRSRPARRQLNLGKLITADILAMLELRQDEARALKQGQKQPRTLWGILRVVDAKTGSIRGLTVASIDEATLEDTAQQFARYVSLVERAPQKPTVTVAVAPFESTGRFDRLRPLEFGIRDLITMRLLLLSGAYSKSDSAETSAAPFQVLHRSNMEQLVRELDLIQSGLSDKSRLPSALPTRQASYLIRGTVDERQVDRAQHVIVQGELVHAATMGVAGSLKFECQPTELEKKLSNETERLVKRLLQDQSVPNVSQVSESSEVESLKELVLADLRRFHRKCAEDSSIRAFRLPGEPRLAGSLGDITSQTPLGRHVLRKSVDRLDSILYIRPDDAEAALALGFTLSMHANEIYQPGRADELLRKAYWLKPQDELGAVALEWLGAIGFHSESGKLDGLQRTQTAERLWFAFEHTPAKYRTSTWPRRVHAIGRLYRGPEDQPLLAELLKKTVPYAEKDTGQHRHPLCSAAVEFAVRLASRAKARPDLKAQGMDLLHRWANGQDELLANYGRRGLARIATVADDFLAAATQLEGASATIGKPKTQSDRYQLEQQRIKAAANYRKAGDPERALKLLLSFKPDEKSISLNFGQHGYEIAACHEALGDSQKALTAYLLAAEQCPGIVDHTDLMHRVRLLGGVPLRDDRDVDVHYLDRPAGTLSGGQCLATGASRLYFAAGPSLYAIDARTEHWEDLQLNHGPITCLKYVEGQLWAGTHDEGVWRCDLPSQQWTQIAAQSLPDLHVQSLAAGKGEVYAGVGMRASGGLVRIDNGDRVHIFEDALAPRIAPTHIIVGATTLLASTGQAVHEFSAATQKWIQHPIKAAIFPGTNSVWTSSQRHELERWGRTKVDNSLFEPAWYRGRYKPGYSVHFLAERGEEVWFGGDPWEQFSSSGLYRFNLKTRAFHKFSPRDGFKATRRHIVYDGLWIGDDLWLATTSGLCVVTPHK